MTKFIPDLNPVSTPLDGTEQFETVQGNVSKRVTAKQINDITTKTQVGLDNVTNDTQLKISANFSDVLDKSAARGNLSVYSIAQVDALVAAAGDVSGPGSSVTGNLPSFADTSGKVIQDSGLSVADVLQQNDIGSSVQAHDADLDALAALAGTGLLARTAANTYAERTLQGGDGIDATNGDGVAGDPSLAVDITVARLNAEDQALTGGAIVTPKDLGNVSTGTVTIDVGDRPLQTYTNEGAHDLTASANEGSCYVDIVNGATPGAITVTGIDQVIGDAFTTNTGDMFTCILKVGPAGSVLQVVAMQ